MPKNINLFIHVVDNYGDIGFAAELIRSFEEAYPSDYFFDIWTNELEKVKAFLDKNPHLKNLYSLHGIAEIAHKTASISLLLFHHPIPKGYPYSENELFLRIDYLSFDAEWVQNHGKEHLDSKENKKIIEIIPSPLAPSGGLIAPTKNLIDRKHLAQKFGLDEGKKWVAIFVYEETLRKNLKIETLNDTQLLFLGADFYPQGVYGVSTSAIAFARNDTSIILLPFLSLTEFTSILQESSWAIIRGEVSFITTLQLKTPFFWDMYKKIGGFHSEQAEQFLDWFGANTSFRDIFYRLNGQVKTRVLLSEIDTYFRNHTFRTNNESKNLVTELQKCIDKYYFSL